MNRPERKWQTDFLFETMACTTSFTSFQGFHSSLLTNISSASPSVSGSSCNLLLQFTIPHSVYVDPHELPHYHHPVHAFNFSDRGAFDIEKPEHAIAGVAETSSFWVEVARDVHCADQVTRSIDVPMHLRYPDPRSSKGEERAYVVITPPRGVWICNNSSLCLFC